MLDDAFKLTIDELFPSEINESIKFSVDGYNNDNMWEHLATL